MCPSLLENNEKVCTWWLPQIFVTSSSSAIAKGPNVSRFAGKTRGKMATYPTTPIPAVRSVCWLVAGRAKRCLLACREMERR